MHQYDLWVNARGTLSVDTSGWLGDKVELALDLVAGSTPMTLTTSVDDRDRLIQLVNHRRVLIQPEARRLIMNALEESKTIPPPLMKPTDYELIAYIDEVQELKAIKSVQGPKIWLSEGKTYKFRRSAPEFNVPFTRNKQHFSEETRTGYTRKHEMMLIGKDDAFSLRDDHNRMVMFRDHAHEEGMNEIKASQIWEHFEKPEVLPISERMPDVYADNIQRLEMHQLVHDFDFYPGQLPYISSVACTDSALVSADTGCGKTLIAISLMVAKNAERVLVIAPKGTVKDENGVESNHDPAQWVKELQEFAPDIPVFKLFSISDYNELVDEDGELPYGVFVSYDHAMFKTRAFEQLPKSWGVENHDKIEDKFRKRFAKLIGSNFPVRKSRDPYNTLISSGVGCVYNGIKCVVEPSMSTLIGPDYFDMVILDEAHLICNLDSQVTNALIRMQPRYKFALTATPIPNMVWNIFSLMGWLCVPDWYQGGKSNPRWPFTRDDIGRFRRKFVSKERDLTQELINRQNSKEPPPPRPSPLISEAAALLKLLRPCVAYISKEMCNPDLQPCDVIDVRVPMGAEQRSLYTYYLDVARIPCADPRFRYGVQMSYLRGICAEPATVQYEDENRPYVSTNCNPKLIAIMDTIMKCVREGEQVVHVSSRINMTNEIANRLEECGITYSRIDGTVKEHATESTQFKQGKTQVMLMGIKCAQSYSFQQCSNLVIGSLEWSYGTFSQAKGRVWRLNSPKPVSIYVILHKDSIEEFMFDKLANKEDAATVCLRGERVERDVVSMDTNELLAEHIANMEDYDRGEPFELDMEDSWLAMQEKLLDPMAV
jgi:SNF2 family DNA or RNA helicase